MYYVQATVDGYTMSFYVSVFHVLFSVSVLVSVCKFGNLNSLGSRNTFHSRLNYVTLLGGTEEQQQKYIFWYIQEIA